MPVQALTFDLLRITSCESVGSEMCSVYHTKCEGENTGSVAGTMTLLCMVTRSGAQHVCVCVCV